ncbi:MAG TPA: response regulator [Polyangiaceae bacterium]|jgi:HD-like signal output (HDOD) protein|nr:response regulator [Polyangiaceae bacterium]
MKRVLFVDDEPQVLEGIRRSLRPKRKEWNMVFCNTMREALVEVECHPTAVVVSDMRMPEMDGAEFLARVAALRPDAMRIILSGQMDEPSAVRAASVAHRFLSKPCDAKALEAVITHALRLSSGLGSDMRSLIGGLESLPSLPQAYLALNQAVANENVTMTDVARIVESDPGMSAKILQLVNSSFFGLPRKMVNISQAASYLGVGTIKTLVLANTLFHALGTAGLEAAERERTRSLLRARIARRLFVDRSRAEAASTAALLLHIGTLMLQSRLPIEHSANVALAEHRHVALHEIERERLGVTHAEVGAHLLGLWGLPSEIIDAVAGHHGSWSELTALDVRGGVRVAEALSTEVLSEAGDTPEAGLPPSVVDRLGISDAVSRMRDEFAATAPGGSR